ncbi:hypothetical protein MJT46_013348 [Ovis ammon polii x Ovis aries]|nr:hypothetical protein MJT46_013348 [Ovis ammon polii x Ovis aries]
MTAAALTPSPAVLPDPNCCLGSGLLPGRGEQGSLFCRARREGEYIMQNAKLYEAQTGIKIARRNINNLRYTDDTILKREELKSLLMQVKEENEKVGLKLNIHG